ncbi:MAG: hypothetical protein V4503_01480 [Gemmatimonadota bacterium]
MNIDDPRLDRLLDAAAAEYRVPEAPPLDAIWDRIDAELAVRPIVAARRWSAVHWLATGGAIAAALILGVFIGRRSAPTAPAVTVAALAPAAPAVPSTDPYQRATDELLGRSAVLLASLSPDAKHVGPGVGALVADQGVQLLNTTRLLLDSPVGTEPRMRALLEDLELVLAQVTRLRDNDPPDDLLLIHDALDQHDIVPRIRSAVARNALRYN